MTAPALADYPCGIDDREENVVRGWQGVPEVAEGGPRAVEGEAGNGSDKAMWRLTEGTRAHACPMGGHMRTRGDERVVPRARSTRLVQSMDARSASDPASKLTSCRKQAPRRA